MGFDKIEINLVYQNIIVNVSKLTHIKNFCNHYVDVIFYKEGGGAELKKGGSMVSTLPEHKRLFPGAHETRTHLTVQKH